MTFDIISELACLEFFLKNGKSNNVHVHTAITSNTGNNTKSLKIYHAKNLK